MRFWTKWVYVGIYFWISLNNFNKYKFTILKKRTFNKIKRSSDKPLSLSHENKPSLSEIGTVVLPHHTLSWYRLFRQSPYTAYFTLNFHIHKWGLEKEASFLFFILKNKKIFPHLSPNIVIKITGTHCCRCIMYSIWCNYSTASTLCQNVE